MSEEAKMYTCSWCGKPTPNYREYLHPMAGILGESGYSFGVPAAMRGVARVDDMHLIRPDTFGALMNDIEAALACPSSEEPTHAYNVVSGMCDACADRCGGTLCQSMALHNICNRIHSLLAGDGE